jgi:hypothetical protein
MGVQKPVELFFVCPEKNVEFSSSDYSLKDDYEIVVKDDGTKQLQGVVELRSLCPLCGGNHVFPVEQVLCPITNGEK